MCKLYYLKYNIHSQVVNNDSLPQHICHDCVEELISSYNFRSKCQASEAELHTVMISSEREKDTENNLTNINENENIDSISHLIIPCLKCFKYYLNFDDLIEHTGHEHESLENINVCCYCSKEYDNFQILWQHTEEHHLNKHIYECGYCTLQCSDNKEIEHHLLTCHFESKFSLLSDVVFNINFKIVSVLFI